MKILVDENIPSITVRTLRRRGHDVLDFRGTDQEGLNDDAVWGLALEQERLLITTDKAFLHYRHEAQYGILIVRLRQPNCQKIHRRIMQALTDIAPDAWKGSVVMIRDKAQSLWH